MCYALTNTHKETKCSTCGKRSWGGCGQHVAGVAAGIPEDQRCVCKSWPGVASTKPHGQEKAPEKH